VNTIKIEKGAIEALKHTVRLHKKMDEYLKEDDKGPSWDGDIILYSNEDLKSENIKYKIPTQVKGKNDENLLKRKGLTYPVEYKNLRNYRNDGGVCYFVIVISNDGERTAIFYNALTPIKLKAYLKGTEEKKPEQTKSIPLIRLENNDKEELYKMLLQFGHDRQEQGSGELVRKAISLELLEKVDSVKTTTYAKNEEDAIQSVLSGEACLYGHLKDADIWVPFEYETQTSMSLITERRIEKPLKADDVVFYENIDILVDSNNVYTLRLSENMSVNTKTNSFNFNAVTELDDIIRDLKFLEALENSCTLYIGEDKLATYNDVKFHDGLKETMNFFFLLKQAVDAYEIRLNKRFSDFDDKNWVAVDKLVSLWKGDIAPAQDTSWYMWWWEGKVVPFLLGMIEGGRIIAENATHMKKVAIFVLGKEEYRVPAMLRFKRDVWEKLYEVEESILLEELEKGVFNKETEGDFSVLLIEVLSAYDSIKNEKYYDLSKIISDKLLEVSPDNDYWKVNRLQILKRKRELTEQELQELEKMREQVSDLKLICAIDILLDNKRSAKKVLESMETEDKDIFISFPIYNLLQ